jgi:hypothetical protein
MDIDYNDYNGFRFIRQVMTENTIKRKEREKFYRKVAIPYMNDTRFRDMVHGKILVFQDGKLRGVVKNEKIAYNLPGKKFAFYIGDDEKPEYALMNSNS